MNRTLSKSQQLHHQFSKGAKAKDYGQWKSTTQRQEVNNVYNIPSTKGWVCYLYAAVGFPVQETWIDAIKAGNYTTWPGLTVKMVNQHVPELEETQKGHMKKQRQYV